MGYLDMALKVVKDGFFAKADCEKREIREIRDHGRPAEDRAGFHREHLEQAVLHVPTQDIPPMPYSSTKGADRNEQQRPKPYLDSEGDPVIPWNSDSKYWWWAGGQDLSQTLKELKNKSNRD